MAALWGCIYEAFQRCCSPQVSVSKPSAARVLLTLPDFRQMEEEI